jgi:hypothetical protein
MLVMMFGPALLSGALVLAIAWFLWRFARALLQSFKDDSDLTRALLRRLEQEGKGR